MLQHKKTQTVFMMISKDRWHLCFCKIPENLQKENFLILVALELLIW